MLRFLNPPYCLCSKKHRRNCQEKERERCHAMQNHELCSTSLHGRAGRGGGRHACRQNGPHISGGWIPSRNNIHIEDIPGTNPTKVVLPKCLCSSGWKPSRNKIHIEGIPGTNTTKALPKCLCSVSATANDWQTSNSVAEPEQ
jgi:hypothetical protein